MFSVNESNWNHVIILYIVCSSYIYHMHILYIVTELLLNRNYYQPHQGWRLCVCMLGTVLIIN
jgi:hypothetical protein